MTEQKCQRRCLLVFVIYLHILDQFVLLVNQILRRATALQLLQQPE